MWYTSIVDTDDGLTLFPRRIVISNCPPLMLSNAASRGYEAVVESDSKTLTLTAIDALLDIFIRLFILRNRGGGG